jgi:hypothetical protein
MCDEPVFWQFVVGHVVTKPFAAMRQPEGSQVEMSDNTYSLLTVSVLLVVSVIGFTYRSVVGNASRFAMAPGAT